jgi:hypothetical protein
MVLLIATRCSSLVVSIDSVFPVDLTAFRVLRIERHENGSKKQNLFFITGSNSWLLFSVLIRKLVRLLRYSCRSRIWKRAQR